MTTSSNPGQPQALSSAKPAPKRRLAVDRIDAHVIGQGQGETYQLLQLPLLVGRAIYYSFAHRGYPTNLQIRFAQRVIFESGFGREARSGWLTLPNGPIDRLEMVLVSRGPCMDSVVSLRSSAPGNHRLSIADGVVLVAAGRQERALLRLPVRLGAPAMETVTVRWRTLAGTASDGRTGRDRADFQASAGLLVFRPGEQERMIEIPIFGDTPIQGGSDQAFEIFARDSAYRQILNRPGLDPDSIDSQSIYSDLGYRVDRYFQGSGGFQALGLTAREQFYVLISDPVHGTLDPKGSEGNRLLASLRASLGETVKDPAYQTAKALVDELADRRTAWTFATATIHDAGRAPVLAIRGTEATRELADVWTDLNPLGIGENQYRQNREPLLQWLREVSQPQGLATSLPPHITGHSLGGALAQWLAADKAINDRLGDVVTFNAPGISRAAAAADHSNVASVRHYVTSTDIVSLAGEALLPGRTLISDVPGSFQSQTPIVGPHLHPVVVPKLSSGSTRPQGMVQRQTTAINNPLFSYLPDPDYLLFLLSVAHIPAVGPALAAALTTRGGVEPVRALIGEELVASAGRYRLGLAMAETIRRVSSGWSGLAWESVSRWSAGAWEAASRWDSQAWESTRFWNPAAWIATRLWNDQAWAATQRWGADAWTAASRWGEEAWTATVRWFNASEAPISVRLLATLAAPPAQPKAVGWSAQAWLASSTWVKPIWEAIGRQQPEAGDRLLLGSREADRLRGDQGNDILDGLGGDDQLSGGEGEDLLIAGSGMVALEGGGGADRFLINSPGAGVTRIADFDAAQGDAIALNLSALKDSGNGLLANLRLGSQAELAEDRLIYDRQSGQLLLDADGSGPGDARSLAVLLNRPVLSRADLLGWCQPPATPAPSPSPSPPNSPAPALIVRISQDGGDVPIAAGGAVALTALIENPGSLACPGAELVLRLPEGVTLIGREASPGGVNPAERRIGLGELAAAAQRRLPLILQLPEDLDANSLVLQAWAIGRQGISPEAAPAAAMPAELSLRVQPPPRADLVLTSRMEVDQELHQPFLSARTVRNDGTATAEHVILTETLPSGVEVEDITGAVIEEIGDGLIRLDLGTIAPGEVRSVLLAMRSMVAGTLTSLSEVSANGIDRDQLNNVATSVYTIHSARPPRSDLQLTLTTSNPAPRVGETLSLRVILSNNGPGDAAGPLVALPCPKGLMLESIKAERGQYDAATGLWEVGSLGVGSSTTLELEARVRQEGLWLTTAEVVDQADLDRDSIAGNGRLGEDDQATIAIRAGGDPITGLAAVQGPRSVVAAPGDRIAIPLTASETAGAERLEAMELALHFDGRALSFEGLGPSARPLAGAPVIEADSDNRDHDPTTDTRVLLRWQEQRRNVPGRAVTVPLVTANFRANEGFADTLIGLSARGAVASHGLAGDPIAVQRRAWSLDIDDDGRIANATDGALLLRYAFGYEIGPDLIRSLIGTGARRRSAEAIGAYLRDGVRSGELDLDGNGRFDAFTDGMMVIRYNADMLQGDQLTAGALAADATITSGAAIAAHLQRLTTLL